MLKIILSLVYSVDVTEAQFSMMGLLIATFLYGADLWETKVCS